MKVEYAFLGGLFPKEIETEILSNSIGAVQNAADSLQWNIVEGLDNNLEKPITIINAPFVGSFPKRFKKPFFNRVSFSHTKNAHDISVPFINITFIKMYSRNISLKKEIFRWVTSVKADYKVIIGYALTKNIIDTIIYAKKRDNNVLGIIIVPDLPQYMNMSKSKNVVLNFARKYNVKSVKRKSKYIDGFVVLTEQMNEFLQSSNYTVMEGIATDCFGRDAAVDSDCDVKKIVYTGTLAEKYGVKNLVRAFLKIPNPNYRLIICGYGDCEKYIRQKQNEDSRIEFLGSISRNEALKLQRQATVLVNPRQGGEAFTKYSFPSKNMEYLSSGVPVIGYKLEGIPEEYSKYMSLVKDNTDEELKNAIIKICEMPLEERKRIGVTGREFVLLNKNKTVQAQKIIKLAESIILHQ